MIYVGEWVSVLGAEFFEVNVIETHTPLSVGFLYHDYVNQPSGVRDLPDELGTKEGCNLLMDGSSTFISEFPLSICNEFHLW